ncbi:MAG TPA: Ku protein [Chloroflexota bacterium]|jgi:DNA end-binding protein Ku
MAAIWRGSLTFGLVNIPVELKTAVRADHISFRLLHEQDLSPVKYERVCQADGETVPWNEIVKGYEYEKGKFVVLTDADFKTAALEQSRTIDILDFVKQDEIDPRYFETPYYLVPTTGGEKPYALLREAIRKTGSVGIGKIIIRQTQHLAGVKVIGDALVLEIMRFANELVDATEFNFPGRDAVRPQELQMAEQLVENLAEPFDPTRYTDDYRANLMKVIKAKMKGKKPRLEEPGGETPDSGVLDLMTRLRASLEEGSGKRGADRVKKKAVAAGRKSAKPKKRRTA